MPSSVRKSNAKSNANPAAAAPPERAVGATPARLTERDRRLAAWLALCVFAGLLPFVHGRFSGSDEVGVYETTRALYERASLSLGAAADGLPHIYEGRGGRRYSHFAVGQAFLALPFFGLGRVAGALLPASLVSALAGPGTGHGSGEVEIFFVSLYAPAATAALAALFFAFGLRLGASRRSAMAAAILLVASTYVGAMAVYFLRHTTEALCILGGLYGFFVYARTGSARAAAFGSAFAAATFLVRVPAALAGLGIGGYVLWSLVERRRLGDDAAALRNALGAIAGPLAAAVVLHVATNWWRWERMLGSPMFDQALGFVTPLHVGLRGFLLSPGVSVFVYAPLLLLLPWLLREAWRVQPAAFAAIVTIAASFLIVCSTYLFWTGLWSAPGPRYVFVAIPLLLLPLGRLLDRWQVHGRAGIAAVGVLAVAGLCVQLLVLLARWPEVIALMDWQRWGPMMGFVFVASESPLVGCARGISQGLIDSWLWIQWMGAPAVAQRPGVALFGTLTCAALLAGGVWGLRAALRRAEAGV